MNHKRWYDKDADLKVVFDLIQRLDKEYQSVIAKDILQMLMGELGLNLDKEINDITQHTNYEYKRWYDDNIDLFVSFEIIKSFPKELKVATAKKILETAILICTQEGESNE